MSEIFVCGSQGFAVRSSVAVSDGSSRPARGTPSHVNDVPYTTP